MIKYVEPLDIHLSRDEPRHLIESILRLLADPLADTIVFLPQGERAELMDELRITHFRLSETNLPYDIGGVHTKKSSPYAKNAEGNELAYFFVANVPFALQETAKIIRLSFLNYAFNCLEESRSELRKTAKILRLGLEVGEKSGRSRVFENLPEVDPLGPFLAHLRSSAVQKRDAADATATLKTFCNQLTKVLDFDRDLPSEKGRGEELEARPRPKMDLPSNGLETPGGNLLEVLMWKGDAHSSKDASNEGGEAPSRVKLFFPEDAPGYAPEQQVRSAVKASRYWHQKAHAHTRLSGDVHGTFAHDRLLSYLEGSIEFESQHAAIVRFLILLSYLTGEDTGSLRDWTYGIDGSITPDGRYYRALDRPPESYAPKGDEVAWFNEPISSVYLPLPPILIKMLPILGDIQGRALHECLAVDWDVLELGVDDCFDWLRSRGSFDISRFTVKSAFRAAIQDMFEDTVQTNHLTGRENELPPSLAWYESPDNGSLIEAYSEVSGRLLSREGW